MRKNPYRGIVYFPVDGEEVALRFTWGAISDLRGLFGKGWENEVDRALGELDTVSMAAILGIISDKPAEWWMEKSPPIVGIGQAIQQGMRVAFFGAGGLDDHKGPRRALEWLRTQFSRAGGHGSPSEGTRKPSGT